MKSQPIMLELERSEGSNEPVTLFGWELDQENAVIKLAENKGTVIRGSVASYKTIMLDLVTREKLSIDKTYIVGVKEQFDLASMLIMIRDMHGNMVQSAGMLFCDYFSMFQFQPDIVVIDDKFRIDSTVEVILENLKPGKTVVRFYPDPKQDMSIDEILENIKFENNDITAAQREADVKKGCRTYLILRNPTQEYQKVAFILNQVAEPLRGPDDHLEKPAAIQIEGNVEIISSMPTFSKKAPHIFDIYRSRSVIHKFYSNKANQVIQPLKIYKSKHSIELLAPSLNPIQVFPNLMKLDIDFGAIIDQASIGDTLMELELLPNTNLVIFFSGK